jgi:hypothetical protein
VSPAPSPSRSVSPAPSPSRSTSPAPSMPPKPGSTTRRETAAGPP